MSVLSPDSKNDSVQRVDSRFAVSSVDSRPAASCDGVDFDPPAFCLSEEQRVGHHVQVSSRFTVSARVVVKFISTLSFRKGTLHKSMSMAVFGGESSLLEGMAGATVVRAHSWRWEDGRSQSEEVETAAEETASRRL